MTTQHSHEWHYTGTRVTKDEGGNLLICVHRRCVACGRDEIADVTESDWRHFDFSTLTADVPFAI